MSYVITCFTPPFFFFPELLFYSEIRIARSIVMNAFDFTICKIEI